MLLALFSCPQEAIKNNDALIEKLKYQIEHHRLPNSSELQPLSYCHFLELKNTHSITLEQSGELIAFAAAHYNPILFEPAKEQISPEAYSVTSSTQ